MKKIKYAIKAFFKYRTYPEASGLLSENSHFPSDPSCKQPMSGPRGHCWLLEALISLTWDLPNLCPSARSPISSQLWDISLQLYRALPDHWLILRHDLGPAVSLWVCAAIMGPCLSLVALSGPDPDLLIDFLA